MPRTHNLSLIAAVSTNQVIGLNNRLPWHLPDDWAFFKQITAGCPFIMGRKSAEAGDALWSEVENVILSSQTRLELPFQHRIAPSLDEAIRSLAHWETVFVLGGQQVFEQTMPLARRMVLTHVEGMFEGDAFFPPFSEEEWEISSTPTVNKGPGNSHPFRIHIWARRPANALQP